LIYVFRFTHEEQLTSEYRLNWVLGLHKTYTPYISASEVDLREITKFGIGSKRNLDDYWNIVGFNKEKGTTENVCQNIWNEKLKRISWKEGTDPFSIIV
jgi:hypothetical protein